MRLSWNEIRARAAAFAVRCRALSSPRLRYEFGRPCDPRSLLRPLAPPHRSAPPRPEAAPPRVCARDFLARPRIPEPLPQRRFAHPGVDPPDCEASLGPLLSWVESSTSIPAGSDRPGRETPAGEPAGNQRVTLHMREAAPAQRHRSTAARLTLPLASPCDSVPHRGSGAAPLCSGIRTTTPKFRFLPFAGSASEFLIPVLPVVVSSHLPDFARRS